MINRKKNMVVSFGDGVTFVVVLHQVWKKEPAHHDFLGFYVVNSRGMSAQTHGLLGMNSSSFRSFRPHGGGKKPRERAILVTLDPALNTPPSLCINPGRPVALSRMAEVGLTV